MGLKIKMLCAIESIPPSPPSEACLASRKVNRTHPRDLKVT